MNLQLTDTEDISEEWVTCCCSLRKLDDGEAKGGRGRPVADPSDITDVTSTGRKRAAMLYPIIGEIVCEWAGLARAGGGGEPIVGCKWNIIIADKGPTGGDIHHSPDKNVLNNTPGTLGGNAHRICKSCHHTWHARNDKLYAKRPAGDVPYLPADGEVIMHDPFTEAEDDELDEANQGRKPANKKATYEQIEQFRDSRRRQRAALGGEGVRRDSPAEPPRPETPGPEHGYI